METITLNAVKLPTVCMPTVGLPGVCVTESREVVTYGYYLLADGGKYIDANDNAYMIKDKK